MRQIRLTLARIATLIERIVGAPDYAAYVAHMRTHHPGTPVLSAAELFERRQRDRFERAGGKCC